MIKGSQSWTVLDGPRSVAVRLQSERPCSLCGGAAVATLQVTRYGWTASTAFEHLPSCMALQCGHGVALELECAACEEAGYVG